MLVCRGQECNIRLDNKARTSRAGWGESSTPCWLYIKWGYTTLKRQVVHRWIALRCKCIYIWSKWFYQSRSIWPLIRSISHKYVWIIQNRYATIEISRGKIFWNSSITDFTACLLNSINTRRKIRLLIRSTHHIKISNKILKYLLYKLFSYMKQNYFIYTNKNHLCFFSKMFLYNIYLIKLLFKRNCDNYRWSTQLTQTIELALI